MVDEIWNVQLPDVAQEFKIVLSSAWIRYVLIKSAFEVFNQKL